MPPRTRSVVEAQASADQGAVDQRYLVGGLVRGLELLRCFDDQNGALSLAELAHRVGATRSSVFRFVYTLEHLGYLRRDPATKRYQLTARVLELGYRALAALDLPQLAQPYLERLRDQTNGSAHLGVLDDAHVRYVGRAASRLTFASTIQIGSALPAHATAMGKVLLAWRDPCWLEDWLRRHPLQAFTERTHTDRDALLRELDGIRERGYAVSRGEYELGIEAVAAPLMGAGGEVVAAINVSGPESLAREGRLERVLVPVLLETAHELSAALGWRR
ncbi:MAG TPA: IclR family transcriptional regulator [Candidatus Dormibacteraeota bacterium]|nr:IclR family transcriptional regulator [Candidatus Dormibacteraeota bacterium]